LDYRRIVFLPLTDDVRAFLTEPRFCVLATTNTDGSIHQSVMWYLLDGEHIVMNTARGRVKAGNLEHDAAISICIEDEYRFVTIAGNAQLDEDQERAHADIARIGARYVGEDKIGEMYDRVFKGQHRISITLPMTNLIVHGF
jgi:PPOX class probable F420-dependent enzyme